MGKVSADVPATFSGAMQGACLFGWTPEHLLGSLQADKGKKFQEGVEDSPGIFV